MSWLQPWAPEPVECHVCHEKCRIELTEAASPLGLPGQRSLPLLRFCSQTLYLLLLVFECYSSAQMTRMPGANEDPLNSSLQQLTWLLTKNASQVSHEEVFFWATMSIIAELFENLWQKTLFLRATYTFLLPFSTIFQLAFLIFA